MGDLKRCGLLTLLTIFLYTLTCSSAVAIDKSKLANSAEKLARSWEDLLVNGYHEVSKDRLGGCKVTRYLIDASSLAFEIKQENSYTAPYHLILNFKAKHCGNNFHSPNANGPYYDHFKKSCGFKTEQDALSNTQQTDFVLLDANTGKYSLFPCAYIDIVIIYLYQNGSWVIETGNQNFEVFFNMHMHETGNIGYFSNLIEFSAQ